MYYYLLLPGIIILFVPVICSILQSVSERRQQRKCEKIRQAASEAKAARDAERAAQKTRKENKKAVESSADPAPKRKRGRPRKNPEDKQVEIILKDPDSKAGQPAPLPTSCTPEQFAAWLENI